MATKRPKKQRRKVKKVVKHTGAGELLQEVLKMKTAFQEFTVKHNEMAKRVVDIENAYNNTVNEISQAFQAVQSNQQTYAYAFEGVDIKTTATIKTLCWVVFEMLLLKDRMGIKNMEEYTKDFTPEFIEEQKNRADQQLKQALKLALTSVHEERAEERKKQTEEAKAAEVEAKIEQEMKSAETPSVESVSETGGQGADVPEGAQVFGG